MTLYARHAAGLSWCAVLAIKGGSVLSYCRGRWSASDAYETSHSPPYEERCEGCERTRIDPVERGLAELAVVA